MASNIPSPEQTPDAEARIRGLLADEAYVKAPKRGSLDTETAWAGHGTTGAHGVGGRRRARVNPWPGALGNR